MADGRLRTWDRDRRRQGWIWRPAFMRLLNRHTSRSGRRKSSLRCSWYGGVSISRTDGLALRTGLFICSRATTYRVTEEGPFLVTEFDRRFETGNRPQLSESNEHYTPATVVELAPYAIAGIDIDPGRGRPSCLPNAFRASFALSRLLRAVSP